MKKVIWYARIGLVTQFLLLAGMFYVGVPIVTRLYVYALSAPVYDAVLLICACIFALACILVWFPSSLSVKWKLLKTGKIENAREKMWLILLFLLLPMFVLLLVHEHPSLRSILSIDWLGLATFASACMVFVFDGLILSNMVQKSLESE